MMRKALTIKSVSEAGDVAAVIATLNVKDKDGDVTLPGFFGTQPVSIVGSHNWDDIMLGKGQLSEHKDQAVFEGKFNLDDADAAKLHSKLKFDVDNPPALVEWSYNLRLKEGARVPFKDHAEFGDGQWLGPVDGQPGVKVNEVSPVLIGAGEGTGTVAVKGEKTSLAEMIKTSNQLLDRITRDVLALNGKLSADGHQLTDEKRAVLASLVEELEKTLATVSPVLTTTPTDDDGSMMAELLRVEANLTRIRELETI